MKKNSKVWTTSTLECHQFQTLSLRTNPTAVLAFVELICSKLCGWTWNIFGSLKLVKTKNNLSFAHLFCLWVWLWILFSYNDSDKQKVEFDVNFVLLSLKFKAETFQINLSLLQTTWTLNYSRPHPANTLWDHF